MKKIVLYSATICAVFITLSCQKEKEVVAPEKKADVHILTCAFPSIESPNGTKVDLAADGTTQWEAGKDKLVIFGNPSNMVIHEIAAADIEADPKVATFAIDFGELVEDDYPDNTGHQFNVAYPYDEANIPFSNNSGYGGGRVRFHNTNQLLMGGYVSDDKTAISLTLLTMPIIFKVSGDFDSYIFTGRTGEEVVGYSDYLAETNGTGSVVYRKKYKKSGGTAGPLTSITGTVNGDGSTLNYIYLPVNNTDNEGDDATSLILPDGFVIYLAKGGVIKKYITAGTTLELEPGHGINLGLLPEGALKTYVEPVIPDAVDLSAKQANCFVITEAGAYKFPAKKGHSDESAGDVASVEVLWETYNNGTSVTANSVIEQVACQDNWVYFKTPATIQPGNALIAAKNSSDEIIWSWHIWIPASDIEDIGDYNVSKKYLMDRNLGAVVPAVVPVGDGTVDVRSVGLYYEWGRKDPFVCYKWGSSEINVKVAGVSARDMTQNSTYSAAITLEQSIANPTSFVKYKGDWLSTHDGTLWGDGSDKTIYDPCPADYRVPQYDATDPLWQSVIGLDDFSANLDGHYWKLSSVVFPISGCVNYDGNMSEISKASWIWNAAPHSTNADYGLPQYVYWDTENGEPYAWASQPGWGKRKACGVPVRCVRIEGEVLPPPPPGANGVTMATDGSISSDWSKAEAIADSSAGIKEWKYGYDADNLYFYFKITRSSIKSQQDELSFRKRRYIWIGFDTNNDPDKGVAPGHDLTIPGCEARALVYPFTGVATATNSTEGVLEVINGQDDRSQTEVLVAPTSTTEDNIYVYGNVTGNTSSDFVYLEMSVPRAGIGISSSFTGIMKVQFTLSGDTTSIGRIEIK